MLAHLFAFIKEQLQADANAKQWLASLSRSQDWFIQAPLTQMAHGIAKRRYAGQHDCLRLLNGFHRIANFGGCANRFKSFLDVSEIANTVVNDDDFGHGYSYSL